jgi:TonB family protein
MNARPTLISRPTRRQAGADEILGWIGGLGFTLLLFLALAHFEHGSADEPETEMEELKMVTMPLEAPPPPPRIVEQTSAAPEMPPLAGIEIAASDSPVRIAVVPPELEAMAPQTTTPPRVILPFRHFHTELKPKMETAVDAKHVYRTSEVDQPPVAINRTVPPVPKEVFGDASTLRVVFFLLIEPNGDVSSTRIAQSSGSPEFDRIVADTVRQEWQFSPAVRRGKKVRCLARQSFRINLNGGGSPFEIP